MKTILISAIISIILVSTIGAANIPHQIAGIVLGKSIDQYKDLVKMDTALPIRWMEYLREVEIRKMEGFKSGAIWYVNGKPSHRIVRIKMKYSDSSKRFYKELLKRYRKDFGKPVDYRGDLFHICEAWKWSFTDSDKNRISLILQHNTRDPNQKMGNCVKMTLWNVIDEERHIFETTHPNRCRTTEKSKVAEKGWEQSDWDRFTPH